MSARQNPSGRDAGSDESDESVEDHLAGTPDEDGPHDVPDDEVIEKTLPSTRIG
ncbi:MAG: hypothetical protein M3150_06995 [Pseudomonadota bacterium]|nr:hypothetical protein [Pseudomonadota bacterium]